MSSPWLGIALCVFLILPGPLAAQPANLPAPKDGPLGMKFVPLPKGTFFMGWNAREGLAKPVEIKADFEIAIYTVTQGQWKQLMGNNPSWFSRNGKGKQAVTKIKDADLKHFPVEHVSWNDVQEFIRRLNQEEKGKGYIYRLPTGTEWEYACRGGATTKEECSYHFYFEKPTNVLSSTHANFNGNEPAGKQDKGPYLERTTMVGSYPPNKLGLYDMHGNVAQWCEDLFVPNQTTRVIRGSSWSSSGPSCRTALRFGLMPQYPANTIGFRLARVPAK
jgi:formylglycine-generating enzyme required for sulfatase activity